MISAPSHQEQDFFLYSSLASPSLQPQSPWFVLILVLRPQSSHSRWLWGVTLELLTTVEHAFSPEPELDWSFWELWACAVSSIHRDYQDFLLEGVLLPTPRPGARLRELVAESFCGFSKLSSHSFVVSSAGLLSLWNPVCSIRSWLFSTVHINQLLAHYFCPEYLMLRVI